MHHGPGFLRRPTQARDARHAGGRSRPIIGRPARVVGKPPPRAA